MEQSDEGFLARAATDSRYRNSQRGRGGHRGRGRGRGNCSRGRGCGRGKKKPPSTFSINGVYWLNKIRFRFQNFGFYVRRGRSENSIDSRRRNQFGSFSRYDNDNQAEILAFLLSLGTIEDGSMTNWRNLNPTLAGDIDIDEYLATLYDPTRETDMDTWYTLENDELPVQEILQDTFYADNKPEGDNRPRTDPAPETFSPIRDLDLNGLIQALSINLIRDRSERLNADLIEAVMLKIVFQLEEWSKFQHIW